MRSHLGLSDPQMSDWKPVDSANSHDVTHFQSERLMDDPVVVEPDLGVRAWMACDALDASIREVFGAEAVNASKRAAEGEPSTVQIVWGLSMDFERERVGLPEPKAMKMRFLLAGTIGVMGFRDAGNAADRALPAVGSD